MHTPMAQGGSATHLEQGTCGSTTPIDDKETGHALATLGLLPPAGTGALGHRPGAGPPRVPWRHDRLT